VCLAALDREDGLLTAEITGHQFEFGAEHVIEDNELRRGNTNLFNLMVPPRGPGYQSGYRFPPAPKPPMRLGYGLGI